MGSIPLRTDYRPVLIDSLGARWVLETQSYTPEEKASREEDFLYMLSPDKDSTRAQPFTLDGGMRVALNTNHIIAAFLEEVPYEV